MKRKVKHRWSTSPPISKIGTTTVCHFLFFILFIHQPSNTKRQYNVGNTGPSLKQIQQCGGVKPFNGIHTQSWWLDLQQQNIYKQTIEFKIGNITYHIYVPFVILYLCYMFFLYHCCKMNWIFGV